MKELHYADGLSTAEQFPDEAWFIQTSVIVHSFSCELSILSAPVEVAGPASIPTKFAVLARNSL